MDIQKTEFKQKIGNPAHWFGKYYFGSTTGGKFILYCPTEPLSKVIELKSKDYPNALKEAKIYESNR